MLKLIGYWMRSLRDDEYWLPHAFVDVLDPPVQNAVARYLHQGQVFETYRGYQQCLCCDQQLGHSDFSDGCWVWPDGLSHYVLKHSVRLPDEFVQHAQSATAPGLFTPGSSDVDDTFWKQWCRDHSSGRLRGHIEAARRKAEHEAERLAEEFIAAKEIEVGTSDTNCLWVDCDRKALLNRALCARHLSNLDDECLQQADSIQFAGLLRSLP